jgi:hypothetical protein
VDTQPKHWARISSRRRDTWEELRANVREAVAAYTFDQPEKTLRSYPSDARRGFGMKLPRDLSGIRLARHLCRLWGYTLVHQVGSHIVLQNRDAKSPPDRDSSTCVAPCRHFERHPPVRIRPQGNTPRRSAQGALVLFVIRLHIYRACEMRECE